MQEAQYEFPYHYLDVAVGSYRLRLAEYVSLLDVVTERVRALATTVLDAACGDGRLCYELRRAGLEVTGVDYSVRAIAFARAFNPGVEFAVADLTHLDLGRHFDTVVLMETLEHLPPDQVPAVLERVAGHLQRGGHLVVTVPSDNVPVTAKHYQHFSPAMLTDVLSPWFTVTRLEGYHLQGRRLRAFHVARRLAYLLAPLAERSLAARRAMEWPNRYYARRLALGHPDQAGGLIATCIMR